MKEYRKQNRRHFAAALVSVLISTIFAVWLQFFKGDVLDFAVAGEIGSTIRYAGLLVLFILCEVVSFFCYNRFSARFVAGCTGALKHDIFESILRRSYVVYQTQSRGAYIAKYTAEADAIRDRYFRMIPLFWEILLRIVLVSAALFMLDWRIAVVTIVLLTTPLYVPKLIEKQVQKAQSDALQAAQESLEKVTDWLAGFEIIKNFSIEGKIMERFRTVNDNAVDKKLRDEQLGAVAQLITTLISYLSWFIVLACAAWLVLEGRFSAGDFFVAIGMIDQLSYPLISLAGIIRQLIAIRPACDAMAEFLSAADAWTAGEGMVLESEIRFRAVSFAYDPGRQILKNFHLTVEKGKRYLLKGPSGCGKTTAVNLLLGYYDVTGGSIEIDGIPLEKAGDPYALMTVVRQDAVLFRDTLRHNLTMYRDIPEGEIVKALGRVGLERLADSLDMAVEEGCANFSGGERKRICLARALLRSTEVLILDEPLANLDLQTAERIEDLLLGIENKTILVVSHQFTESKLEKFHSVVDFGM